MKTSIEDTDDFSDLLNFNVKFRDINSETGKSGYNNIRIQTSTFGDIKKLAEIIREITISSGEAKKIDIDINRFLTYSYACIDGGYWNDSETEKLEVSTEGVNLITSSVNTENYTSLPFEFENEYLYTYIFTLYQKLYFKKMLNDFEGNLKGTKARKEFVKFTNDIWVHEVTAADKGILLFRETKEVLELNKLYEKVKEQYDVTYKNFNMKNSDMLNKLVLVLLAASVVTNIVNFINLYKMK